jgi:RNA polymerase sigma factor for flagellar operon FliA
MSENPAVLMAAYLGLVRALAWKIHQKLPRHVELDDLVGYGCIGLAEAAKAYESQRGVKFSTFAHLRIRGAIMDGLEKMSWFRYDQFESGEYRQTEQSPEERNRSPARMPAEEVADREPPVDGRLAEEELHQRLRQLVANLPPSAAELMQATYFEGMTLKDAAERMGHTKSWASRLHSHTVDQLAKSLRLESLL